MILAEGSDHYRPTTWDAAFELIGKTLNCLRSPNHAAFYTSGKTSNEAAFLYQLFAPAIWDEQFARLFQHVPRIKRLRLAERDRRGQRNRQPRRF